MTQLAEPPMSVDAFLRWQETREESYELVGGRPKLMTGGSVAHGDIIGNIFSSLRDKLKGKPCKARMEVAIATPGGNVRHPGVLVDCGPTAPNAHVAAGPTVVIEVTSPGSLSVDYLQKPRDYASIATVSTYLIVNQDVRRAAILRRSGDGFLLEGEAIGSEAVIDLPEIGIGLPLPDVYEGLDIKD